MHKKESGYKLKKIRELAAKGHIVDPVIIDCESVFTFRFSIKNTIGDRKNCVLITVKGAEPREFKRVLTYTRVLKKAGIEIWRVKKRGKV
ncbi:hypothetical protein [Microbulbifer epialgicus]|uniref:Uncharacterized protein n=1 Tax=Microbulbifer epialgicus TaxID=393907 RepID=A0ABV4NTY6_9GAMM